MFTLFSAVVIFFGMFIFFFILINLVIGFINWSIENGLPSSVGVPIALAAMTAIAYYVMEVFN
jgi:hypothetical protein